MPNKRIHTLEELDNLELKGKSLTTTLDGLSKINFWLGNSKYTLEAVKQLFQKNKINTIVDLGCGGGDNLTKIAKWLNSKNKTVKLIGIDGNQNSLGYAKSKSKFDIEFLQADILDKNFELPECDLLISSHFIYHFDDESLISFLQDLKAKVKKAMIFSELRRSMIARILFYPLSLFFSKMVRNDGVKAIRRSFTKIELIELITKVGFKNYTVKNRLIFRLLAVIETNS